MGKKSYLLFAAGLMMWACGTLDLESKRYPSEKENESGSGLDLEKTVFMSVVAYEDAYDWQNDPDWNSSRERLLLLGGDRILYEEELTDPSELHYVVKGALWQCRLERGKTVLFKNGERALEWKGEESVWDMAQDGEDMLCICSASSATGGYVCLRKNGTQLRRYEGCYPTGGFYVDGEDLLFGIGGSQVGFVGCKVEHVAAAPGYDQMELRRANGGLWMWWKDGTDSFAGNSENFILGMGGKRILGILHDGADVYVEESQNGEYSIVGNFEKLYSSKVRFDRRAVVIAGNDIRALGTLADHSWAVFREGNLTPLENGLNPVAGAGLALSYGRLMFPVTLEGGVAGVWDNGEVKNLGLNGYVDHITIGRGSSKRFWLSR